MLYTRVFCDKIRNGKFIVRYLALQRQEEWSYGKEKKYFLSDAEERERRSMNRNYQKELEKLLEAQEKEGRVPTLFLHSCCAPCSSYVLEYLSNDFKITVFYYNPNIFPAKEYEKRVEEQQRLIREMKTVYPVKFQAGMYEPREFYEAVQGLEKIPEGGERCFACYELRMRRAAQLAKEGGYDYFTTTLSISPLKNAAKINEIGEKLELEYGVRHLPSDFKKKNGYQRSIALSREYGLYRQDYCGCVYSQEERKRQKESIVREDKM